MPAKPDWLINSEHEVTQFNGDPIPEQMEFPHEPPFEIGPVLSAYSTCVHGRPLTSKLIRFLIILGVYLIASIPGTMALGFGLHSNLDDWIMAAIFGGIFGLFSLPFSWYFTRKYNWLGYVGTKGVARFELGNSREAVKKRDLLEFVNAVELVKRITASGGVGNTNGINYRFTWKDVNGQSSLTLAGSYNGRPWLPKPGNPFYLGKAAEITWTEYLRNLFDERYRHGDIRFAITHDSWIRVGSDHIELQSDGRSLLLKHAQIRRIQINASEILIHLNLHDWVAVDDTIRISCNEVANAQLLKIYLNQFYCSKIELS